MASAAAVEIVTSTIVSIVESQSRRFHRKAKPMSAPSPTRRPATHQASPAMARITSGGGTSSRRSVPVSIQPAMSRLSARVRPLRCDVAKVRPLSESSSSGNLGMLHRSGRVQSMRNSLGRGV